MSMSPQTANAVGTVLGMFVIVMVAMSILYYGWETIVVLLIGLLLSAVVIKTMTGGGKKGRGPK